MKRVDEVYGNIGPQIFKHGKNIKLIMIVRVNYKNIISLVWKLRKKFGVVGLVGVLES